MALPGSDLDYFIDLQVLGWTSAILAVTVYLFPEIVLSSPAIFSQSTI